MDNKFNNAVKNFLESADVKDDKELNEKLQEFMEKYNNGEIEYENTPLDDAYEILEEAEYAKTYNQALKLAKKAYEICPACFDAILFQADLEENSFKRMEILEKGLKAEKERLTKEKYFEEENIGEFYGIFETRPYMRGLVTKAQYLLDEGKLKQARDICIEAITLNEHDNLGARYLLLAIYATLEEEKDLLELYKKYPEENFETLFSLFALYYKLGDEKKAKEYFVRVDKANHNIIKLFKGKIKMNEDVPAGCYSRGDSSEIIMYVDRYTFLLMSMPKLGEYISEYEKATKNSKKKKVSK